MKSPNARLAYAYGPPVRGSARPRFANTSASSTAPAPVNSQPSMETGPAAPARVAGSRKTPEPTMLPTTSAVAIHRPIDRFSFGAPSDGDGIEASSQKVGSDRASGPRRGHRGSPGSWLREATVRGVHPVPAPLVLADEERVAHTAAELIANRLRARPGLRLLLSGERAPLG